MLFMYSFLRSSPTGNFLRFNMYPHCQKTNEENNYKFYDETDLIVFLNGMSRL